MTERTHSRTGLLMTEILLAVLFFALAAAGCLRVFAGAADVSRGAEQLKLALNSTENIIQQLKSVEGNPEKLWEFYPEESVCEGYSGQEGIGEGIIYFDGEGRPCAEEEMDYQAELQVERGPIRTDVEIVCTDHTRKEIYQLSTAILTGVAYETEK